MCLSFFQANTRRIQRSPFPWLLILHIYVPVEQQKYSKMTTRPSIKEKKKSDLEISYGIAYTKSSNFDKNARNDQFIYF